jgi:hypothetical protein
LGCTDYDAGYNKSERQNFVTLIIEVPADLEALIKAEAETHGLAPEVLVLQRLVERYSRARAEAQAILDGRFRPQAQVETELHARRGGSDLSHLSDDELDARVGQALDRLSAEQIAQARREGLL